MGLEGIFFMSVSIASWVVSVAIIVFVVYFIKLMNGLGLLKTKAIEVADEGMEAAEEAREYIGRIGKSAVNYYVVKLLNMVKRKK